MRTLNILALVFALSATCFVNKASALGSAPPIGGGGSGGGGSSQNGGGGAPEPTMILLLAAGGGVAAFKRIKSRKNQTNSDQQ
jgi:hypothetical protein